MLRVSAYAQMREEEEEEEEGREGWREGGVLGWEGGAVTGLFDASGACFGGESSSCKGVCGVAASGRAIDLWAGE